MYSLERTKLSFQKDFDYFPIFEILISKAPNIHYRNDLPRGVGDWLASAPRCAPLQASITQTRAWQTIPAPHGPRAKRSVGVYTS